MSLEMFNMPLRILFIWYLWHLGSITYEENLTLTAVAPVNNGQDTSSPTNTNMYLWTVHMPVYVASKSWDHDNFSIKDRSFNEAIALMYHIKIMY